MTTDEIKPRADFINGEWVKRDFHATEPSEPNPDYVDSTEEPLVMEFCRHGTSFRYECPECGKDDAWVRDFGKSEVTCLNCHPEEMS